MRSDYYFHVADKMLVAATDDWNGLTKRAAATRVLHLGCKALEQACKDMQEDPKADLYWEIRHFDNLRREYGEMGDANPLRSIEPVLDAFLVAEANLFEEAKVPPYIRNLILSNARDLLSNIDALPAMDDQHWPQIRDKVCEFKEEICVGEQVFLLIKGFNHLLRKGAFILGGAGVMALNSSPEVLTKFGFPPWMTVLSAELGRMMMYHGTEMS